MKAFWTIVECVAAFMVLSAMMFAFTGLHWWSPLEVDQYGRTETARGMLLTICHIIPIFAAFVHRATATTP